MTLDTHPDANRDRDYSGGYMQAGHFAEEAVLAWLRENPAIIGIQDLRQLRVMREADVDCSITLIDGRITLAEVKSDRHLGSSGNFLFEILRINHTAPAEKAITLGWSARSPARQLLYYSPTSNTIHALLMDEFRKSLQTYTQEVRGQTRFRYVPTDKIKSTICILVPEKFVIRMPSYKKHDIGMRRTANA